MPTPEKFNIQIDTRVSAFKKGIMKMIHPDIADARNNKLITSLLKEMVQQKEFMLVLVFNRNRTQVEILPLPEVFKNNERYDLCEPISETSNDAQLVLPIISTLLKKQDRGGAQMDDVLSNVIVIEQNLGDHRNNSNLVIGYWFTHQAQKFQLSAPYDHLIRNAQNKLNRHASGK